MWSHWFRTNFFAETRMCLKLDTLKFISFNLQFVLPTTDSILSLSNVLPNRRQRASSEVGGTLTLMRGEADGIGDGSRK